VVQFRGRIDLRRVSRVSSANLLNSMVPWRGSVEMGRLWEVLLELGKKWMDRDSDMFCDGAKRESLRKETLFKIIFSCTVRIRQHRRLILSLQQSQEVDLSLKRFLFMKSGFDIM
jgi:hypothetical protein